MLHRRAERIRVPGETPARVALTAAPMTVASSQPGSRWSLKRQIRALGILFLLTILITCAFAAELVRHSNATRIADAKHQLEQAATGIRERYLYLAQSFEKKELSGPQAPTENPLLSSLTASALSGMPRVEGGFYFKDGSRLLGYAYPTYQGSGPKTDIPPAEQPAILGVVQQAVESRGLVQKRIDTASDVLLFCAVPLERQGSTVGAVWVLHHIVGVRNKYDWLNAIGLILLLVISAAATAAAWHVTRRLDAGVFRIETALGAMEYRLDSEVSETGIRELDRIAAAIDRLGKTLNLNQQRRIELEQKLRHADRLAALGRLVAGVAHEVRNPLASIKLKLHLAQKLGVSDATRLGAAFDVMGQEIDRIDRLVERLLALGRPPRNSSESVDIGRFLAERLEVFRPRATAQNTALELHTSSLNGSVSVDRDRLGEVVDNLVANAMEAVKEGGRVLVEAERSGASNQLVIRVADTGPGVVLAMRDRLFEPFATTKDSGMGLGLFLSAEIVRGLGGEISYRDVGVIRPQSGCAQPAPPISTGACFEVRLPC
jgi:signal transduction histidine kinase